MCCDERLELSWYVIVFRNVISFQNVIKPVQSKKIGWLSRVLFTLRKELNFGNQFVTRRGGNISRLREEFGKKSQENYS